VTVIKRFSFLHHFILPPPPHQPDSAGIRHIWTPGGNAHSGHSGYSGSGRKIQIVYAKAVAPLLARLGGPYPSFTTAGIPDLELRECVSEAIVASTVNVDNLFNQSAVATRV
jgi:hypothetical protein